VDNLIVHDFLRDTLVSDYKECIYCKSRTQFTCVRCGYCYTCHWKREELDRVQLETSATTANYTDVGKYSPAASTTIIKQLPSASFKQRLQQQEKVIDVYGQETEPICSYRRCHNKFSEHGHNCKCHHALNYAIGISILPLTKI
jgi:hypothetical protein